MGYPVFYVPAGDVLPVFFASYDGGTGASAATTGLAVTDVEIYKDGSVTQRASDAGYTLLDTDGLDFDGITGINGFSIDTGDNTDAGFYTVGSWFTVVVSSVTVDAQTVNFIACQFRLMAAEDAAAVPDVNVTHFGGTAGTFASGIPEVKVNNIAANAITATSINADAITAAKVAADVSAEIADAVWDELQADHVAAGSFGEIATEIAAIKAKTDNLPADPADASDIAAAHASLSSKIDVIDDFLDTEIAAILAAVDTEVAAILADTNELQTDWANGGRLDLILDARAAQTTADAIEADTQDIQARLPAALTAGGNMKADSLAVSGSTAAADKLEAGATGLVSSTCAAGSTTTSVVTNLTEATDDHYNGRVITFTGGALAGQSSSISDYNGTTKALTVVALTEAPADTDAFVIS